MNLPSEFVWQSGSCPGRLWKRTGALFELGLLSAQKQGGDNLCTIHTHRTKQTTTQLSLTPVPASEVSASDHSLPF